MTTASATVKTGSFFPEIQIMFGTVYITAATNIMSISRTLATNIVIPRIIFIIYSGKLKFSNYSYIILNVSTVQYRSWLKEILFCKRIGNLLYLPTQGTETDHHQPNNSSGYVHCSELGSRQYRDNATISRKRKNLIWLLSDMLKYDK